MPFTLATAITSARDRHPAFHKTRVPDAVLARYLSDVQNEIIVRAATSEPTYLAQSATITLHLDTTDAVGTAGAGTAGGVPGTVSASGTVAASQVFAGSLVTLGLTADDGGTIVVAERVVTSATSTTTTSTGAGRTVDADIGRLVVITAGTGQGQVRSITANTAATWTHLAWDTVPDTTSLIQIVAPSYDATEAAAVITALPITETRTGFLVKLSSAGVPYLDYTEPITATVDGGAPLPAMQTLLGGTIRYTDDSTLPLTITSFARRTEATPTLAVYAVNETVRLCGEAEDWTDVASIEVLYTPLAPTFTALTDLFLLPDGARTCIVAHAAAFMALRVSGTEGVSIDPAAYEARAMTAQQTYSSQASALPVVRVAL